MPTVGWEEQQSSKENSMKDHEQPQQEQRQPKVEHDPDASIEKTVPKTEPVEAENGEGQRSTLDVNRLNVNFASPYDSDRKDVHLSSFHFHPQDGRSSGPLAMPHRVESYMVPSSHRRHYDLYDHRRQSPPLSTLTHAPSPAGPPLDRGHISTPPIRRASPHGIPPPHLYPVYPPPDPALLSSRHHFLPRESIPHGYIYHHPPPHLDPRYDPHPHGPPQPHDGHGYAYHHHSPMPPHPSSMPLIHPPPHHHPQPHHPQHVRDPYPHPYPSSPHPASQHPAQPGPQIMHTDDAATKLSDRVRRRCFNCCTTDTSTWRRSNLHPGKVLCNKCGLFERTHSRPRPEQFPHKRGPLATSTLRSRSPTQSSGEAPHQQANTNPAPSAGGTPYYSHPSAPPLDRRDYNNSAQGPGSGSGTNTPLTHAQGQGQNTTTTLPGPQSWNNPAAAAPAVPSDTPAAAGASSPRLPPASGPDPASNANGSPNGGKAGVPTPTEEKNDQGETAGPPQNAASTAEAA